MVNNVALLNKLNLIISTDLSQNSNLRGMVLLKNFLRSCYMNTIEYSLIQSNFFFFILVANLSNQVIY